jgi:hypothetical protein
MPQLLGLYTSENVLGCSIVWFLDSIELILSSTVYSKCSMFMWYTIPEFIVFPTDQIRRCEVLLFQWCQVSKHPDWKLHIDAWFTRFKINVNLKIILSLMLIPLRFKIGNHMLMHGFQTSWFKLLIYFFINV